MGPGPSGAGLAPTQRARYLDSAPRRRRPRPCPAPCKRCDYRDMNPPKDNLMAEFPPVTPDAWRAVVDRARKGASFDKLVSRSEDGFAVQPIYVRAGATEASWDGGDAAIGVPGKAPYRRGTTPAGRHADRWDMRQGYDHPDLDAARAEIAADLGRGVTSLWLRLDGSVRRGEASPDGDGLCCRDADELSKLLGDVVLDAVGLSLRAGGNGLPAFALLAAAADRAGVAVERLSGNVGMDPLGALAGDGVLPCALPEAARQAGELACHCATAAPGLRTMLVDTAAYHDAGATAGQEIGYALATGVSYLRWLTDAGLDASAAAGQLAFSVRIATDFFTEIAKLRALRHCWARVVQACGGDGEAQRSVVHAAQSSIYSTARDPWVNMLRTTTGAFSAAVGGADAITTDGFDSAVGRSDAFARRIASNAQVVLNEEAHVAHVADPAGGSYYVESLTDALASAAWQVLQTVEAAGGMAEALGAGTVGSEITAAAAARASRVAKRRRAITGVSEFANLAEEAVTRPAATLPADAPAAELAALSGDRVAAAVAAAKAGANVATLTAALRGDAAPAQLQALPVRPVAAAFEQLRDRADAHVAKTGEALRCFLCNLGGIPDHKARSSYATGFLNAGGIACLDNDGFADVDAAVAAFTASGARAVMLCGSDDDYSEWVPQLVPKLAAAGATVIALAGRPGDREAAHREAGVGHFIYMGCDVAQTLQTLQQQMGVQ